MPPDRRGTVLRLPIPYGVFVAVVGPSGAGKDTLINHAKGRFGGETAVLFVRRVITRASDGAGEDHDTLTPREFDRRERRGGFALSWEAHGLKYGVPAEIDAAIGEGKVAVANLSRSALPALRQRYANVRVVHVTAPPEVLAARLAGRGRESEDDIRRRIARSADAGLAVQDAVLLENDGPPEIAGERLITIIRQAVRESVSAGMLKTSRNA
jgi:ribose 1,5-bisphosphokinase